MDRRHTMRATDVANASIVLSDLVFPNVPHHIRPSGFGSYQPFFAEAASQTFGQSSRSELITLLDNLAELTTEHALITPDNIAPYARTIIGVDRFLNRRVSEFNIICALPGEKHLNLAQASRLTRHQHPSDPERYSLFNNMVMMAEESVRQGIAPPAATPWEKYGTERLNQAHHAI